MMLFKLSGSIYHILKFCLLICIFPILLSTLETKTYHALLVNFIQIYMSVGSRFAHSSSVCSYQSALKPTCIYLASYFKKPH